MNTFAGLDYAYPKSSDAKDIPNVVDWLATQLSEAEYRSLERLLEENKKD